MQITVSIGQMEVRGGEPAYNLELTREWVAEAARRGSDIIIFPELWDIGYAIEQASELASPLGGGWFSDVAALAKEHGLYVTGSLTEARQDGATCNSMAMFSPDGELMGIYRKLHLFSPDDEGKYIAKGDKPLLLDLPWGRTGLAICYDLRFPELFRRYALEGAEVILLPAAWPHPRLAHWRTLLRARAIENQMYVIACNSVGQGSKMPCFGHSAIIDPWGEEVVEAGETEVLLTAEVDLSMVEEIRQRMSVFADRRPEVYAPEEQKVAQQA
jgi:predicted amidohydrolase